MSSTDFELVGHDCPLGRYPAPVAAVGRLRGTLVAVYWKRHSLEVAIEELEGTELETLVRHSEALTKELAEFDYRRDRLFAFSPDRVVCYKAPEEAIFFESVLRDEKFASDNPFLRLALAKATDVADVMRAELAGCWGKLIVDAPLWVDSWYAVQRKTLPKLFPPVEEGICPQRLSVVAGARSQGRVLVVDDEPDVITFVGDVLLHHGYEILGAADGEEGLEKARLVQPDVVVVDIMMPRMNGNEMCHRLKEDQATARIPVLALTARNFERDENVIRQCPADAFMKKPFDNEELACKIAALCQRSAR
jgi:CheY-like chemotaxis protein